MTIDQKPIAKIHILSKKQEAEKVPSSSTLPASLLSKFYHSINLQSIPEIHCLHKFYSVYLKQDEENVRILLQQLEFTIIIKPEQ